MRLIERLNLSWHINVIVKYEVISTLTEQNIRNSLSWHGPGISMRRDGVIASVRQGAALALASVVQAYGK
jgi:hypothetical protein